MSDPICDEEMTLFETQEREKIVVGWCCDLCGWSFDDDSIVVLS